MYLELVNNDYFIDIVFESLHLNAAEFKAVKCKKKDLCLIHFVANLHLLSMLI